MKSSLMTLTSFEAPSYKPLCKKASCTMEFRINNQADAGLCFYVTHHNKYSVFGVLYSTK